MSEKEMIAAQAAMQLLRKGIQPMPTRNKTGADKHSTAPVQTYVLAKGEVFEGSTEEIADLMTDLLHLAVMIDQGDEPAESTYRIAWMNFEMDENNRDEEK